VSEAATADPTRMHLVNLATGEDQEAQFNPEELEQALDVNYAEPEVVGLSHQPMQYVSTKNLETKLTLYCTAQSDRERDVIDSFRAFILELCYAPAGGSSIVEGSPARVLFVWPRLATLTCRVTSVRFKYATFAKDGGALRYTAEVTLKEARDARLTAEQARMFGMQRGGEAPRG